MATPQTQKTFFDFSGGWNTEASPLSIPENDALTIENVRINPERGVSFRKAIDIIGQAAYSGNYFHQTNTGLYYGASHAKVWTTSSSRYLVVVRGRFLEVFTYDGAEDLKELDNPLASFGMDGRYPFTILEERENLLIINNGVYWLTYDPDYEPYHPEIRYDTDGNFVLQDVPITWRNNRLVAEDFYSAYYNNGKVNGSTGLSDADGRTYVPLETHTVTEDTAYYGTLVVTTDDRVAGGRMGPGNIPKYDKLPGGAKVNRYWELYENSALWDAKIYGVAGPPTLGDEVASTILALSQTAATTGGRTAGRVAIGGASDQQTGGGVHIAITHAGRAWYASSDHPGKVFFSQSVTHEKHLGRCWSMADPRNPYDSTIVESDGGVIELNGAGLINGFAEYLNGVLVFSENGIWYIRGLAADEAFTATTYSVERIWKLPVFGFGGIVNAGDSVLFNSPAGIYLIQRGRGTDYEITKITSKIETYMRSIDTVEARRARMFFDDVSKKVYVLHNQINQAWMPPSVDKAYPTFSTYHRVLVFDVLKTAWYLYTLTGEDDALTPGLSCIFSGLGYNTTTNDVLAENGDTVTDDSSNQIIAYGNSDTNDYEYNVYGIAAVLSGGSWAISGIRFAATGYTDFASAPAQLQSTYDGTLVTAWNGFGDVAHKKETPYITFLMKRTETGEFNGDDTPTNPGGLLFAADWNWAASSNSNYYGTLRQIYHPDRLTFSKIAGTDEGHPYIRHKQKVRGFGPALSLRFTNDGAKAFELMGWQIDVGASRRMK